MFFWYFSKKWRVFIEKNISFLFYIYSFIFVIYRGQFPLMDFSTPLSPSYEEGVLTPVPKPYAPTIGARDVTAPTRRSEPLRSKVVGGIKAPRLIFYAIKLRFLCGVTPP